MTHIPLYCRLDQLHSDQNYPFLQHYYSTTLKVATCEYFIRVPINTNNDDENHVTLVERHERLQRTILSETIILYQ